MAQVRYDPTAIENKWAERWHAAGIGEVDLSRPKRPFYNLMMFPYPSAEGLHVGNVYAFTGADVYGRFTAMRGYDVFEPIGFDAFGIHSENFALKRNTHPKRLIAGNVENFRHQLHRMEGRFAWNRTVDTTQPEYYRWTQWIFLQMLKSGLAEKKVAPVNWCPSCLTVLANEQVIQGACERCGTAVTTRHLEQWFLRITAYADRLLDHLDGLDWSEVVKTAQRNWIGRSRGLEMAFPVVGTSHEIAFFTTRPDTIHGATFVVLAPEHPLALKITTEPNRKAVRTYVEAALSRRETERLEANREKTGVDTGAKARNLATGEEIPVYVADYVLGGYGTGAIMAVPAHDERDFEFARAFGLGIRTVVVPAHGEQAASEDEAAAALDPETGRGAAYGGAGMLVNSGSLTGLDSETAKARVIAWAEEKGYGNARTTYRLRDWLISRQRYWGPPVPVVYCEKCGTVPVPEDELPVLLPDVENFRAEAGGASPLAAIESFVHTTCPSCHGPARRDTDVSDNFLDSAWYFLRYPSTDLADVAFDPGRNRTWLPVDMYIGGREHSVLHLMYTRFVCMALHDMGYLDFEEPFKVFRAHGTVIHNGAKMSKSRGNVVNPDELFDRYGADTVRTYLMFMGPFQEGGDYSDAGIQGVYRFLGRVWDLAHDVLAGRPQPTGPSDTLERARHRTVRKATEGLSDLHYNTVVAALMEYLNTLTAERTRVTRAQVETLLLLLAPFAPAITDELWESFGHEESIACASWPEADPRYLVDAVVEIPVQVNGRLRDRITLTPDLPEAEALTRALEQEAVLRAVGKPEAIRRVVYVPGRMLNLVVPSAPEPRAQAGD